MARYVHVSFDIVEHFEPRIPRTWAKTEDRAIKRICVTDRIQRGLNAMAQAGLTLQIMQKLGLPLIIHAYYMESENVIAPEQVQNFVPDALTNHESWLTETPKRIWRVDYEVIDPVLYHFHDDPDPKHLIVASAPLRTISFSDNVDNFVKRFHIFQPDDVARLLREHGFSAVLCNLEETLLELKVKEDELTKRSKKHEQIIRCNN